MNILSDNPYTHFYFLYEEKQRLVILKEILSSVIKPGMSVLDIGTGSLAILAIMAAKLEQREL